VVNAAKEDEKPCLQFLCYSLFFLVRKIKENKKKITYSLMINLYWSTMFTCFLYVILPYGSTLSPLSSFMKIEMPIRSVRTSNNKFNQNLFSSSEAETCRWTDVQTQSPTYAHSLCAHCKQCTITKTKHSESSVTQILQ
jgi:hypothetical protein